MNTLIQSQLTKDGQEVKARQYGTHTWKRLNGQWRLVHEHLTVG
jgi:ketosteroid isomerase-like protein